MLLQPQGCAAVQNSHKGCWRHISPLRANALQSPRVISGGLHHPGREHTQVPARDQYRRGGYRSCRTDW